MILNNLNDTSIKLYVFLFFVSVVNGILSRTINVKLNGIHIECANCEQIIGLSGDGLTCALFNLETATYQKIGGVITRIAIQDSDLPPIESIATNNSLSSEQQIAKPASQTQSCVDTTYNNTENEVSVPMENNIPIAAVSPFPRVTMESSALRDLFTTFDPENDDPPASTVSVADFNIDLL